MYQHGAESQKVISTESFDVPTTRSNHNVWLVQKKNCVCTDYEVESLWVISTEDFVKEKKMCITKMVVEKERNEMVAPVKVLVLY